METCWCEAAGCSPRLDVALGLRDVSCTEPSKRIRRFASACASSSNTGWHTRCKLQVKCMQMKLCRALRKLKCSDRGVTCQLIVLDRRVCRRCTLPCVISLLPLSILLTTFLALIFIYKQSHVSGAGTLCSSPVATGRCLGVGHAIRQTSTNLFALYNRGMNLSSMKQVPPACAWSL